MYLSEKYAHIPAIFFALLSFVGIYKIFFEEDIERKLSSEFSKLVHDDYTTRMLKRAGGKLTAKTYFTIVYALAGLMFVLAVISGISSGNLLKIILGAVYALLIIWILKPRDFLYKQIKSPFKIVIDAITNTRVEKCDREIYSSCIILKNLAIVQKEKPMAADIIFETLQKNAKYLKVIYTELLALYRTGYRDEAFKTFANSIGTSSARNYAALLEKVDRINPAELLNQVQSLLETMQEKRLTDGYKKAQRNGIITMLLSTLCIMAVLGDFLLVVVFMDMVGNMNYLM